jgi:hypothetical protein
VSPRIHNLGDFANCLPVVSGLYKYTNRKIWFVICDRLQRFKGIKELLLQQEMFEKVTFYSEEQFDHNNCIVMDDTGSEYGPGHRPMATQKYSSFLNNNYRVDIPVDDDFELSVSKLNIDFQENKLLVGDRWSPKDAPDVDDRRYSNMIESENIIPKEVAFYLDYSKDLVYNCSLIKYNPNPLITTFTGIGILADLMKKDVYILWGEDVRNWQGKPIDYSYHMHYYGDRKSVLQYVKDYKWKLSTI